MTKPLVQRESNLTQLNRILKPLGMEIKPKVKKDSKGRVIVDPSPKPKKVLKRPLKVYKKVSKPFVKPKRQYVTKKPKSTLFGFSFKSGGSIGSKKGKKQSGHNRLY
jgi:hypothetical protein